ncbi:benzoate/H(+) symporter BenE family transporter [Corynebacterium cystitidis]|uniref:Benzoate membrane transport protein n=1 Tax=Corynebacterium cystitidis DSM 20524 TaxID=1121357 RepID=A0A1H9SQZ2_9CORY|nr:benzoate/H(+) symporter BenE family transporter [Corynebacterium cystitidis]WJY83147.1 Inner membrane protein YdcO [Corynebacterium cystitidis DSM 20524]SER87430.1 benzoate membrane transport protein [Corynebacterium cystitidis DSM 20524]SNV66783.1 benzoate membrane transport protein [Corynebacterium cystitidis]
MTKVLGAIERPQLQRPTLREFLRDVGPTEIGNGLVAFIFSASGPVAVILAATAAGNLTAQQTSSWILGAFLGNGLITLTMTYLYRSPMAFYWTIPGTVLVGTALTHLTLNEVVGAYLVTGILVFLLGWTGLIRKIMDLIPATIVMAMVAGVFLHFGVQLIGALIDDPIIAIPMTVLFVILTMIPWAAKWLPPVATAAVLGTIIAISLGLFDADITAAGVFATPQFVTPVFSWAALVELVIPLAITVVFVQNGQGLAVLRAANHKQGINLSATVSGLWSIPVGLLGCASTCLTGPTNALIVSSQDSSRHYAAAIVNALAAITVGIVAPVFVAFMLGMPASFIAALAGLAMLTPLKNAFVAGFSGPFSTGALVCFLVTIAEVTFLGLSAPFWGLVAGVIVGKLLDKDT